MKIGNFIILLLVVVSCKSSNEMKAKINKDLFSNNDAPRPPVLVYKTRNDYNNRVPVLLSDDKKEIISYPDPKDLKVGSFFLRPTLLENGYLLDNKGIGKNVAFLKYSYSEYSNIVNMPPLKNLYNDILDKNPIIELYNCGNSNKFNKIEAELNQIINKGNLKTECEIKIFTND